MMKRLLVLALGIGLNASAWAAPGDRAITLTVPVSLSKMDPVLQGFYVKCWLAQPNQTGIVRADSQTYPIQNGAANVQATVTIQVPAAQVQSGLNYSCLLFLVPHNEGPLPATTNASGAMRFWSAVTSTSTPQVSEPLKP